MTPATRIMSAELELGNAATVEQVRAALRGSTVAQAALGLGVGLRTLYRWLARYPALGQEPRLDARRRHGRRVGERRRMREPRRTVAVP